MPSPHESDLKGEALPFFSYNSIGGEAQYVEPPIPDQPEVSRRSDSNSGVKIRRVLDAVTVKALGVEFQHFLPATYPTSLVSSKNKRPEHLPLYRYRHRRGFVARDHEECFMATPLLA